MNQIGHVIKDALHYILGLPYCCGQILIIVSIILFVAIIESNLRKDEKEGQWGKIK